VYENVLIYYKDFKQVNEEIVKCSKDIAAVEKHLIFGRLTKSRYVKKVLADLQKQVNALMIRKVKLKKYFSNCAKFLAANPCKTDGLDELRSKELKITMDFTQISPPENWVATLYLDSNGRFDYVTVQNPTNPDAYPFRTFPFASMGFQGTLTHIQEKRTYWGNVVTDHIIAWLINYGMPPQS